MLKGTQVGAYRVLQQLGKGGMGSVWLVEHVTLGRRAALKVLHAEYSTRPEFVARFHNEARAATAIADPGIVQIFEVGQHVDGRAYIVMELLDGEPLSQRLKREEALTLLDGLRLIRQVASTLGAAHARGIIHRDLKPENIFIVRDPEVPGGERAKVLDFGIAKLLGEPSGITTHTSLVMGTPTFMSPEQCRGGGRVDQRSDVYALGCVLFMLVTGQPPFVSDGVGEIIAMHLREPAPAPSQLRPGIPPELDQLVLRCLAKAPAKRFPTAKALAMALDELLGSSPQVPEEPTASYSPAPEPTTLSAATGASSTSPARRSRVRLIAAFAAFVLGGAIAVFATRGGEQPAPAQLPAPVQPPEPPQPFAADPPSAPEAAAPRTPPDPSAQVAPILRDALARFVAWSREHAGAPCPDAAMLGAPDDPWGHPPAITCTDQPGDQIAGAISAGPDGKPGTDDDIASWQLGRDVTDVVRGARWAVASPTRRAGIAKPRPGALAPTRPAKASTKPARPVPLDDDGLPTKR